MAPLQRCSSFSLGVGEFLVEDDHNNTVFVERPTEPQQQDGVSSASRFLRRIYGVSFRQSKRELSKDQTETDTPSIDNSCKQKQPYVDMNGSYQLIENRNFEKLLEVQGVPWALRRAANRLRPIHRFTHSGNDLTIKIEGIIETSSTYSIGGPPSTSDIRGRKFEDTLQYVTADGNGSYNTGIQTVKRAIDGGYTICVKRMLSEDRQTLTMTSTVNFEDTSKESVQSTQIFELMKA